MLAYLTISIPRSGDPREGCSFPPPARAREVVAGAVDAPVLTAAAAHADGLAVARVMDADDLVLEERHESVRGYFGAVGESLVALLTEGQHKKITE